MNSLVSRRPILVINPPSPRGMTVNREGFGGLGTLVPGRKGFAYPALALAEAAAVLLSRRLPVRAGDCVIEPWRGPSQLFRSLPELDGGYPAIVRAAAATLDHDLEWIDRHLGRWSAPLILAGTALDVFSAEIAERIPRAVVVSSMRGEHSAWRLLELRGESVESTAVPTSLAPAFNLLPLGRSRRLPFYFGRGCAQACNFCPYIRDTGRSWQGMAPSEAAARLRVSARLFRPRRVVIRDPHFGHDFAAVAELLEHLAAGPEADRIPLEAESRPDQLDLNFPAQFRRAGGVELKLGLETWDIEALLSTDRVASEASAEEYRVRSLALLDRARAVGLPLRLFVLRGLSEASDRALPALEEELSRFGTVVVKDVLPSEPGALRAKLATLSARR